MLPFSAAVLAGGRSRRFGRDKARFVWRGKPLLQHVLDSLEDASERFIVANRPYPEFGVPVVKDPFPGEGPLSGIIAALSHAAEPVVAVAACDLPRLVPGYWVWLLERLEAAPAVAVAGPSGRPEPLAAFYTKALLPLAERVLRAGERRPAALLALAGARVLPWEAVSKRFDPALFLNANTPEDLIP